MTNVQTDKERKLYRAFRQLSKAYRNEPYLDRVCAPERLESLDPLAADAARVILSGDRWAYLAALEQGGPLRLILESITREHKPEPSTPKRDAEGKIKAALTRTAHKKADAPQYGTGSFPAFPKRKIDSGFVITFSRYESGRYDANIAPAAGKGWHWIDGEPICPAAYASRVRRQVLSALYEAYHGRMVFMSEPMGATAYRKVDAVWRQRESRARRALKEQLKDGAITPEAYQLDIQTVGVRKRTLPQEDGSIVVLHTDAERGDRPFPNDRTAAYNALYPYLNTPHKKKLGGTPGWGGDFQGTRGDGRKKQGGAGGGNNSDEAPIEQRQLWSKGGSVKKAADALGIELDKRRRGKKKDVDPVEAWEALKDAQLWVRARGSLQDFFRFAGVTRYEHCQEGDEAVYPCCDTKPPPEPPQSAYLPGIGDF